ncbi:MAG: site-specific DNA-methyltransferase [Bacteroidota bacterium]|jgi:site-specific DNA-methyltransferase (adenine-specific)|nr:site-specific DNA-methyltransferase [Bacteroidota bacterium]NLP19386.1 site-specific DNA-methyltransferase [Bacteroidales bacterium]HNY44691.1 site-specific DNA-methyltransferase [Bacteroidales bacterium]
MKNFTEETTNFSFNRLPKDLQKSLSTIYSHTEPVANPLKVNAIHQGDASELLKKIEPNSIAVSVWSPPYFVGKNYEKHLSFEGWKNLLKSVIANHFSIIKPGGFLAINIADILVFKDEKMPKIQADAVHRKRISISKENILEVLAKNPTMNRNDLAKHFKCSEQTIDRRLHGNNVRGGKQETQSRVKIIGGLVENWALEAGFYPYDRRIWVKDAAWENSKWANLSYRSVDEFEYIYIFWKPGITRYDRNRLSNDEWKNWGSRGVWQFPSVRANDDHEAKFPLELPTRIIKLLSDENDIVLDCFMGSGTTAIAAIKENRNYIGIELNPEYVKLSKANILKETGVNSIITFNAN